jgi:hypothetical protein
MQRDGLARESASTNGAEDTEDSQDQDGNAADIEERLHGASTDTPGPTTGKSGHRRNAAASRGPPAVQAG